MPRARDKSWVDFLPGRTGIQNENVPPGPPFRAARDVPHELTSFEPEVLESLALRDRDQTRVIEGEERDRSGRDDSSQTLFRSVDR